MNYMRILALSTVSLMVFMGGCQGGGKQTACEDDRFVVIPGLLSWSARDAERYAHYHDAGGRYEVDFRANSGGGYRDGDGYRKAHDYYEPRSGW